MSNKDIFTVTLVGDRQVIAKMDHLAPNLKANLVRKMQKLALMVQRQVVEKHLSGPTGTNSLSVGTRPGEPHGKLRRSVQQKVTSSGDVIHGSVFYTGDVPYTGIHEFGGTINVPEIVPNKAGALSFMMGGKQIIVAKTRAHTVQMPERAPLRTGFSEMISTIENEMHAAVRETIEQ